jgi:hypothetical protein
MYHAGMEIEIFCSDMIIFWFSYPHTSKMEIFCFETRYLEMNVRDSQLEISCVISVPPESVTSMRIDHWYCRGINHGTLKAT